MKISSGSFFTQLLIIMFTSRPVSLGKSPEFRKRHILQFLEGLDLLPFPHRRRFGEFCSGRRLCFPKALVPSLGLTRILAEKSASEERFRSAISQQSRIFVVLPIFINILMTIFTVPAADVSGTASLLVPISRS
jgi:hypothetical protein